MRIIKRLNCVLLLAFAAQHLSAQLVVNGGTITIESGASIVVKGDVVTTSDIVGAGKVVMNGTALQQINTNGYGISNLEISNASNVALSGNTKVASTLSFVSGKIQTGNYAFTLANNASVTGAGAGKFIETTGTGVAKKEITTSGSYELPIGAGSAYMPLQYVITGSTITAGAYVSTQLIAGVHPNKPVRAVDNLPAYWKSLYSGVTGGSVNVNASYSSGVNGTENLLNAMKWDGTDWSVSNTSINLASKTISFNNVSSGTELYAMDKFVLMNAKAFLQGAFNSSTGKMNDNLRAGTNLIPLSDPYRTAPYNTSFTHTNNPDVEIANASVFADQAIDDNNIVDWVFLELRNTSSVIVQTRSALLQKDGDIVDIDGVSPVAFTNVDGSNYIVTVRHRNHLGMGADVSTYAKSLSVANPSTLNKFDFTVASDAEIFGPSTAYNITNGVNLMWGGNANFNTSIRYNGPANDRDYLLSTGLGGNQGTVLNNVYSEADVNMNRVVRYNGPSNDRDFMLATALGGSQGTIRTQAIPN